MTRYHKRTNGKRAVVAMSGGVDSSVAAMLLAREGYEVIGVTMRLFAAPFEGAGRLSRSCCSLEDVDDARTTCRRIGARHFYLNFEKEFKRHVIDYFVAEYENGRTPHPCIACNDKMKFEFLMRRADAMEADVIATGHYARIAKGQCKFQLLRGADPLKDQSYVLYNLRQEHMAKLRLPIGEFTKDTIRSMARDADLPVADKPDSQDICFVPFGNYREFVEERMQKSAPGEIVDDNGHVLGRHSGVHNFTIGQRKGLPIVKGSTRVSYVYSINSGTGQVRVGPAHLLMRRNALATRVNWIDGESPKTAFPASVRIRYNGREEDAVVIPHNDDARILFSQPMRAITPGQAAVFYDDDRVIGGGVLASHYEQSDESI